MKLIKALLILVAMTSLLSSCIVAGPAYYRPRPYYRPHPHYRPQPHYYHHRW